MCTTHRADNIHAIVTAAARPPPLLLRVQPFQIAVDPLTSEDAKEVENAAGTIRADKVKAEKAAAAKKGGEQTGWQVARLVGNGREWTNMSSH